MFYYTAEIGMHVNIFQTRVRQAQKIKQKQNVTELTSTWVGPARDSGKIRLISQQPLKSPSAPKPEAAYTHARNVMINNITHFSQLKSQKNVLIPKVK